MNKNYTTPIKIAFETELLRTDELSPKSNTDSEKSIHPDEQKKREMVHSVFVQESKSFHPILQSVIRNNFDDFANATTVFDSTGSVYKFLIDIRRQDIREVARELLHNYSNMLLTRSCCNDFSELDSKLVSGF